MSWTVLRPSMLILLVQPAHVLISFFEIICFPKLGSNDGCGNFYIQERKHAESISLGSQA